MWIIGGRHPRVWVTRRPSEEPEDTFIVEKTLKKRGWMFWASFSSVPKASCLFWEKEWKSINKQSYCDKTLPLVYGWLRLNPRLEFVQDGAPGHAEGYTIQELNERGITPIFWPPYSSELNLIEAVWNKMKSYIEVNYPDLPEERQRAYDQLRDIVLEVWDSITVEDLRYLIDSMKERCQAVINTDADHTKY